MDIFWNYTLKMIYLTIVLSFFFPFVALNRHLLSPSCSTPVNFCNFFVPRGFGFGLVCPWSFKNKKENNFFAYYT